MVSSFPEENMEADFRAAGYREPGEAYGCSEKPAWNGFYCQNRNIGVLLFESLDADTNDRSLQPIEIYSEESKFYTKVNSFMDHVWDGFYTGQVRLSRFPVQIVTGYAYVVKMSGTPP